MIEWTEKVDKYRSLLVIGKINGIQICAIDCRINRNDSPYWGKAGDFSYVRIRNKWNTKEGFAYDNKTGRMEVLGLPVGNNIDLLKQYCEMRWKEWYTRLGLTRA
jgi:hypothetical protein